MSIIINSIIFIIKITYNMFFNCNLKYICNFAQFTWVVPDKIHRAVKQLCVCVSAQVPL